ncbi:MAG: hypothetical protein JXR51_05195 [Bacteroidales bacterium]|nr:hypothetical protein [Bacteroidales bacterium]MBN2756555.1 hypothetical protein [Bacteroidales bacterium]
MYSGFFPDSEYANNYKYCLFMMLHKDNLANIYVTFLANDIEKFNEHMMAGFYAVKFKE